ncbi:TolB-like translocation protein [Catellatospora vulcania]|uniref:hypothetical protein n=1 Tax=Catellatospora vulcania TaxID=1460450 RepID=UPI0012D3EDC9|nr:hypothetical protein [Catellatospora vulcania]
MTLPGRRTTPPPTDLSPPGLHRHPATLPVTRAVALLAALGAAGLMLALSPRQPAPPRSAEPALTEAYPGATAQDTPGTLADGSVYSPLYFVSATASVGTALSGDDLRLLLRDRGGERELRRMPKDSAAEFAGFTSDGTILAWMELSSDTDGAARSGVWTVRLDGGAPRLVTEDTGPVMLFDKQGDLALHDGMLSWMADTGRPGFSAIRTVPLAGGKPVVQELAGGYAISAWPWLVGEPVADGGSIELANPQTAERILVGVQAGELMSCSATWCRSLIIGSTEASTVIELLRPDGSERLRTVTGAVSSAITDVAVLDRFEVYTRSTQGLTTTRVMLYDLKTRSLTLVTANAGRVASRGGVLWWSTGDNETLTYHALDLRTLP